MSERVLHCWKSNVEDITDQHGFGSEQWAEAMNEMTGTCMLKAGHEGDHEFTPDSDITFTFAATPTSGETDQAV